MKVFPVTASFNRIEQAPSLVYQIWAEESGENALDSCVKNKADIVKGVIKVSQLL